MPFELHIALRYLLAKRRQAFISVISLVSTLGVAVGVAAVIIALALMTGLQNELRDRLLGSQAHVYVWKRSGLEDYRPVVERLLQEPGIVGAAPAIFGKAIARTSRGEAFITFKGIDPSLEAGVTDLQRAMRSGSLDALTRRSPDDPPGIILGQDLANQISAYVGDDVSLVTPEGTLSPMGLIPRARRFRVVGVFALGLYQSDAELGVIHLRDAASLMSLDAPELLELKLEDVYAAREIADRIPEILGDDYVAEDWVDRNQSLFSALWIEKIAVSIAIGLIIMVAALNIIASLVLLVMEKSRDIAILKTMGASSRSVMTIFMLQGLVIGIVGTASGAFLGWSISTVLDRYRLIRISADVYQISHVPFTIVPLDFAIVVMAAVLICFTATLYPSRQAARLDPVQALRFE
ncbi:MAG TPA: FtsX-like permease family protein [Vicinamibacterales bacterium]|nr:FtsX-like permease family protein [Vicinamibacterales bacterium]